MQLVGIGFQTYFSIQHIQSAAFLARQAFALEREQEISFDSDRDSDVQACACGSVFSSIAFLEALVNELFADAAKSDGGHLHSLPAPVRELIAELGATESVERAAALRKFAILLRAAGKPAPPLGANPAQDLQVGVELRNHLTHYKAHWLDMGTSNMVRPGNLMASSLLSRFKGKFAYRPRVAGPSSDQWLGHGCSEWVCRTAIQYVDLVSGPLGIVPLHDHVRSRLATR